MSNRSSTLMHPVRLRVIGALAGRHLTRQELARRLSDVPQATLYRHVKALLAAGMLEAAEQHMVRGVVETTFRLKTGAAHLNRSEFAALPRQEHLSLFELFAGEQMADARRYFEQPSRDTTRDGMTYFRAALLLNDRGARALRRDLLALVKRYATGSTRNARMRFVSISSIPEVSGARDP